MNIWTIMAIAVGLLIVVGVVISVTGTASADEPAKIECKSCGNSCTAEKNCGLATCGAVNGGTCTCGK